jgi:hypothetical protein
MDWIFDHLNVVLFVVIGIVSVFKSILDSKAQKKAEEQETSYPEEPFEPEEEEIYPQRPQPSVPPPLTSGGAS